MGVSHGMRREDGLATFCGLPVKQVSLILLVFQNSAVLFVLQYSRTMPPVGDHRYFPSTAVFLCEVLKLAISLTLAMHDAARRLLLSLSSPLLPNSMLQQQQLTALSIFRDVYRAVFSKDSWKLAIPAALYTLQNTLLYAAVENLDAVHYQVLCQLKILSTAFFTVVLLRRSLPVHRWIALVLLTLGISVVSLAPATPASDRPVALHDASDHLFPRSASELASASTDVIHKLIRRTFGVWAGASLSSSSSSSSSSPSSFKITRRSATYKGIAEDELGISDMNYAIGLSAVLTAAATSGLAGVFLESILKSSYAQSHHHHHHHHHHHTHSSQSSSSSPDGANIWTRNVQMAFYSLFAALFGLLWRDGGDIAIHGFFDGYSWVVWLVIVLQAVDGLLASVCIQYADNIAKNFATSFSVLLSFVFSLVFFEVDVSATFLFGASLVLFSAYIYTISSAQSQRLLNHVHRGAKPSPLRILTSALEKHLPSRHGHDLPYSNRRHDNDDDGHADRDHNCANTVDSLPLHPHSASGTSTPVSRLTPRLPSFVRIPSAASPRVDDGGGGGGNGGFLAAEGIMYDNVRTMGLSTSRPASPMVARSPSWRKWDE